MFNQRCFLGLFIGLAMVGWPKIARSQSTSPFQLIFPKVSHNAESQLVISNLSTRRVTAEVMFVDSSTSAVQTIFVDLEPGNLTRMTPPFDGTAVIKSTTPLSVTSRVAKESTSIDSIGPAAQGEHLVIPFSQGTSGDMEVSVFNPSLSNVSFIIGAISASGETLGITQESLEPLSNLRRSVASFLPPTQPGVTRDVSHILIRSTSNIFSGRRILSAAGVLRDFISPTQGVARPRTDMLIVNGVSVDETRSTETLPFFVQGSDFFTVVQVVNPSAGPASVILTPRSFDGASIPGANPATIQLPANGSIRMNAVNLFNLSPGFVIGSIAVEATAGIIASASIGNISDGSFTLLSGARTDTNFAFPTKIPSADGFAGLSLLNPNSARAQLTLRLLDDEGTTVSRFTQTLDPAASLTRQMSEVFPEAQKGGLLYLTSDLPIFATLLEGRFDGAMLLNLAPMHSQPDFEPAPQKEFLATGVIRHNGKGFPGVTVFLEGAASRSAVTDSTGAFVFPEMPRGQFTVTPQVAGFTFSPARNQFTIADENNRSSDFAATLIKPVVTSVTPSGVVSGSAETEIVVAGGPFGSTSEIVIDGTALTTTLGTIVVPVVAGTAVTAAGTTSLTGVTTSTGAGTAGPLPTITVPVLKARLTTANLLIPRIGTLAVRTTGPGGNVLSDARVFVVGNPAPVLSALTDVPVPLIAGNTGFNLKIKGTGFMQPMSVRIGGGLPRPATVVDETTISVALTQSELAAGANLKIEAFNPDPTIGPSNALTLPVFNVAPGLVSVVPNVAEVRLEINAEPLSITVNGFGFRPQAIVALGGTSLPTDFVNSTRLAARIPAANLQTGGPLQVTVKNPEPSMQGSEGVPFIVINLPPTLSSIDSGDLKFDSSRPGQTFIAPIILHGSNIGTNSIFEVASPCGSGGTPSFGATGGQRISPQQVILSVPITCTGVYMARIQTPQPGGGVSATQSFTVNAASNSTAPTILSTSPTSVTASSATFTLTITGSSFETGAFVSFGSALLKPISVTATTITVSVPDFLIREAGLIPLIVTNPSASGSSNRVLFNVGTASRPPGQTGLMASGSVRHNGVAFANVTLRLSGSSSATGATDVTGSFSFSNLSAGSYTVTPEATGFTFSPATLSFSLSDTDARNLDFGAILAVPVITSLTPVGLAAGSSDSQIVVAGGPFISTSVVVVDGIPLLTTLGSLTVVVGAATGGSSSITLPTTTIPVLRANVSAALLATARTASLVVRSSGPGGTVSSAATSFTIGNPAPVLSALSDIPSPLISGNPGFTLKVTGTGFMVGVTARVGGVERSTVLMTDGTLRVSILQEDLAAAGLVSVTATNPSPTVGPSNALTLAVSNPVPGITSISPTFTEARLEPNALPLTLTVNGFGFKTGAVILVGGAEIPTTFVNATQLTGRVPTSSMQVGASLGVSVRNPAPTLGFSESLPLLVTNLVPILTSISGGVSLTYDPSRPTDTYPATIILHGSNFGTNVIVELLSPCTTGSSFGSAGAQRVSTQQIVASVSIACAGTYLMRVRSPQPGGGVSQVQSFTVTSAGPVTTPTLTGLSPSSVTANSGTFTLTITGTGFESGAFVFFGSAILVPSSVTTTSVTVTVPNFLIPIRDQIPILVTNPSGTGSSNRLLLTVN